MAFALPFIFFLFTGRLRGGLAWKCLGVFALGGLQGAIGWYMVKSGLVEGADHGSIPGDAGSERRSAYFEKVGGFVDRHAP